MRTSLLWAEHAHMDLDHQRQIRVVFGGLLLGMLLGALDQTIVATALPRIVSELGGLSQLSWVITAYLLASTVSIPLWGKSGDLYGRKRLFQLALAVFLAGSALCGIAGDIGQLIAFRAVQGLGAGGLFTLAMAIVGELVAPRERGRYQGYIQGLGAGGLFTLAMAIVGELVAPRERGRYQGYIQAMFALASVAGPLIGGSIVDHASWRWLFYVNLPLGAVALAVISVTLQVPSGAFALPEQRGPEPIRPLPPQRNPIVAISSAGLFFATSAFFAAVVFLPVFIQLVRGDTATSSGLLLLPMMLATTLSAASSGHIISRTGRYKWFPLIGLALMAITLFSFAQLDAATPPLTMGLLMALFGLGFGMVGEVLILAVQNAVDQRDLGTATGAANLFRALGGSVGVAVYGSIFTDQLRTHSAANPLALVFMTAALMAAAGFIVVLFLEERPLRQQTHAAPATGASSNTIPNGGTTHVHA